jgi:Uridine kinase
MAGFVIAIAGAPGSGKSTLARALADALPEACVLAMDSYEHMTRQSMEQLAAWAARGADVDELPLPLLAEHLAALKAGRAVTDPATGAGIAAAPFIVFETQFGRSHRASGQHIDWLVWLDTPRELALARTLRQLAGEALDAEDAQLRERLEWLASYLGNYLGLVRQLLVQQRERVLPQADLVVDGTDDPARLAAVLCEQILRHTGAGA